MRLRLLCLLSASAMAVGLALAAPPAHADDVAISPGCAARSLPSDSVSYEVERNIFGSDTQVVLALSECDTQRTIAALQRNAWGLAGCALAFDALGTAFAPVKLQASVAKITCSAAALSNAAFAGLLAQADQRGGGCGTVIKFGIRLYLVPGSGLNYSTYGFTIVPRVCPPGVTPKAEVGGQLVAGTGAGPIDWETFNYAALPDLADPSTDPVHTGPDGAEAPFASVAPAAVATDNCGPVTITAPTVDGIGADSVAVTGTSGLDQLGFGTASVDGTSVLYTPTADGTDTVRFTYGGPLEFDIPATVTVSGCGDEPGPRADVPGCPNGPGASSGSQGCTIPATGGRYTIFVRTEAEPSPGSAGGVGHVSGWDVSPGSTLTVTSAQYGCREAFAYPGDCPATYVQNRDQINVRSADGSLNNLIVIRMETSGWPGVTDGTGPFIGSWWVQPADPS